jgi:predicted DNA-binding transcriptional regulator AlpA
MDGGEYGLKEGSERPPVRINKVMELSGYSRSYIYNLVYWKKIPVYKPTNGRLFFCESEVMELLARGRRAADCKAEERAEAAPHPADSREGGGSGRVAGAEGPAAAGRRPSLDRRALGFGLSKPGWFA